MTTTTTTPSRGRERGRRRVTQIPAPRLVCSTATPSSAGGGATTVTSRHRRTGLPQAGDQGGTGLTGVQLQSLLLDGLDMDAIKQLSQDQARRLADYMTEARDRLVRERKRLRQEAAGRSLIISCVNLCNAASAKMAQRPSDGKNRRSPTTAARPAPRGRRPPSSPSEGKEAERRRSAEARRRVSKLRRSAPVKTTETQKKDKKPAGATAKKATGAAGRRGKSKPRLKLYLYQRGRTAQLAHYIRQAPLLRAVEDVEERGALARLLSEFMGPALTRTMYVDYCEAPRPAERAPDEESVEVSEEDPAEDADNDEQTLEEEEEEEELTFTRSDGDRSNDTAPRGGGPDAPKRRLVGRSRSATLVSVSTSTQEEETEESDDRAVDTTVVLTYSHINNRNGGEVIWRSWAAKTRDGSRGEVEDKLVLKYIPNKRQWWFGIDSHGREICIGSRDDVDLLCPPPRLDAADISGPSVILSVTMGPKP